MISALPQPHSLYHPFHISTKGFPHGGSSVVLITSRREDWARVGGSFNRPLMEEASPLLLLSKTSLTDYGKGHQKVKILLMETAYFYV